MLPIATLLIQCPDAPGIVARISTWIFQRGGNIIRSDQYSSDPNGGVFFMRLECYFAKPPLPNQADLSEIANHLNANIQIFYEQQRQRTGILVSQQDHCLSEMLYHWRTGELLCDITCVVSNHQKCEALVESYGLPFYYLPMQKNKKAEQEQKLLSITQQHTDFLILARYMQILSGEFLSKYQKPIINIHHSFLPSFVGADPYKQAYDRGVKIIGATAHYITEELDEGPIIEQNTERVSLQDDVKALQRKGRHIERLTLLRAVQSHLEHRVIRFGNKTVVFN